MFSSDETPAMVYGRMDAWCRGINELFNIVDNINRTLPRPLCRIDTRDGVVCVVVGSDSLLTLPNWDMGPLDDARAKLSLVSDFAWALYKSDVSAL